ncbi:MAG: flavodoxin domain-containing protein [Lachnospiraceae bacterium]|nr:flavodoxin domain-containing protein [Lachnospiraceae bacterium]
MKTLIIYTSQTGFTKKYAGWIAERTDADLMTLKEARKKDAGFFGGYDAIVYGGWTMAGTVVSLKWFLDKAAAWKDKRLALFCVGGSPNDNPEVEVMLRRLLTDEQRQYIAAFYCQGGFNYEKMNIASRLAMKMFVGNLKKKKNASGDEKKMAEMISSSYDISDISYTDPIVEYLKSGK